MISGPKSYRDFRETGPRFSFICQTDNDSINDTSIWKSLNEATVRMYGLCYVDKIKSKNITLLPILCSAWRSFFFLKCLSFFNPLISNIGLSIIYNSPLTSNFFLKFLRNKVFSPFTKSFRKISWKVNEIPTKWISFIMWLREMRVLPFWILVRLKWRSASAAAGEWVVLCSIRFGSCESMASQPGLRETGLVAASRHITEGKASHKTKTIIIIIIKIIKCQFQFRFPTRQED